MLTAVARGSWSRTLHSSQNHVLQSAVLQLSSDNPWRPGSSMCSTQWVNGLPHGHWAHARHSIPVIVVNIYLAVSRLVQGGHTGGAICPSHPTPRPGRASADTRSLTGRHLLQQLRLMSMGALIDRPVTNNKLYPVFVTALITSSQLSPH